MSFSVVCKGCGAPSSPSVGICPFCKTVMTNENEKNPHSLDAFMKLYNEGKLERALSLGTEMHKADPELEKNLHFVISYTKVLLEAEAPSSKIRGLLTQAHLLSPESTDINDYLDIVEAKNRLKKGINDSGETMLRSVLRRSPNNVHAHFVLGTHLFWADSESLMAIPHLEACVRIHPNFLRAWGCLGAIYKKLGNAQLAKMAFEKCATLETDEKMKAFFQSQANAS